MLRNNGRCAVELVNHSPHIDVARGDAFAFQFLRGLYERLLLLVPHLLKQRKTVEPTNDELDVLLRIGPVRHAGQVELVGCCCQARALAVGIIGIGVGGKLHRRLRMRSVRPAVSVANGKRSACSGTQFITEILVVGHRFAIGKLCLGNVGQCVDRVYLLDEKIYGGKPLKVEVAVFLVLSRKVVRLLRKMEHALALVANGHCAQFPVFEFKFDDALRVGSECRCVRRVVPHSLNEASPLRLPLVTDGNGCAIVTQFGDFEERTSHDALELRVAVEINLAPLNALAECSYGQVAHEAHGRGAFGRANGQRAVKDCIAENVDVPVRPQVLHREAIRRLVVVPLRQSIVVNILGCGNDFILQIMRVVVGHARH